MAVHPARKELLQRTEISTKSGRKRSQRRVVGADVGRAFWSQATQSPLRLRQEVLDHGSDQAPRRLSDQTATVKPRQALLGLTKLRARQRDREELVSVE